jgi:hypothetical protein
VIAVTSVVTLKLKTRPGNLALPLTPRVAGEFADPQTILDFGTRIERTMTP